MKLTNILLIIIALLHFQPGKSQKKSDVEQEGLTGNVKYMHNEIWNAEGNYPQYRLTGKLSYENQSFYFNKKGMLTAKVLLDTSNIVRDSCVYYYNESDDMVKNEVYDKNNMYQQVEMTFDPDKNLLSKKGFEYGSSFSYTYKYIKDSSGKTTKIECLNPDSLYEYVTLTYNTTGNVIKRTEFYSDGTIKKQWDAKYDTNGNLIEKITYDPTSGMPSSDYKIPSHFKYNEKGLKIEEIGFNSSGNYSYLNKYNDDGYIYESYTLYYDYIFNENGEAKISQDYINNVIQEINEQNYKNKIKYSYNNAGRETESLCVNNNYKVTKQYDNFGNIIQENNITWKYEYDQNGNWTKKIKIMGNKLETVNIRKIQYY